MGCQVSGQVVEWNVSSVERVSEYVMSGRAGGRVRAVVLGWAVGGARRGTGRGALRRKTNLQMR